MTVAFEVVTNNYGQAEIRAKQEFCQVLKLEYEQRRV
ncbi:hypothetical protein B0H39_005980 [Clostridium beijerinckii]|nr:hypothetical protein [Clostridium beijerinckii]